VILVDYNMHLSGIGSTIFCGSLHVLVTQSQGQIYADKSLFLKTFNTCSKAVQNAVFVIFIAHNSLALRLFLPTFYLDLPCFIP
jgi:hypothetical protein